MLFRAHTFKFIFCINLFAQYTHAHLISCLIENYLPLPFFAGCFHYNFIDNWFGASAICWSLTVWFNYTIWQKPKMIQSNSKERKKCSAWGTLMSRNIEPKLDATGINQIAFEMYVARHKSIPSIFHIHYQIICYVSFDAMFQNSRIITWSAKRSLATRDSATKTTTTKLQKHIRPPTQWSSKLENK